MSFVPKMSDRDSYDYMYSESCRIAAEKLANYVNQEVLNNLFLDLPIHYLENPGEEVITQYPHCDPRILHAPKECEFCDMRPDWQELRKIWNICFTNEISATKTPCPAIAARGIDSVNGWYGNVPKGKV